MIPRSGNKSLPLQINESRMTVPVTKDDEKIGIVIGIEIQKNR